MQKYKNIEKVKNIERKNKKILQNINPRLDEESGIYVLWRTETHGYVGQSVDVLTRLAQHMVGYESHIDLSIRSHGLYSESNKGGYHVESIKCSKEELDQKEREYIQKALNSGWILKNKTSGGQDSGKFKIAEYKPSKGYYDGLNQGRLNLARELSHIAEKHLDISLKAEKQGNKVSQKQFEKFMSLINEGNDKE